MLENEILTEIRRTREEIAREHDYDVAKLFAHFRKVTTALEAEGWQVAPTNPGGPDRPSMDAAVSSVLREEPAPTTKSTSSTEG